MICRGCRPLTPALGGNPHTPHLGKPPHPPFGEKTHNGLNHNNIFYYIINVIKTNIL